MADFPPVASLRSFEAVARLGSVTQAAHEMSVTHSAVSQHIKQLEALVGVTLFIRHGRGVRITEEGRLYALQIREALQHIADATRMVQIKPRTLEVTLATLPSFGCHWLLPRLARFQARHPQIAVRLLTSLAVVNLQQEGIDLAIRMGQGDWEEWKAGICLPMNSWWSPPPAIAAVTCRPPRRRSPPAILFFPWSPGTPGAARRGWKKPIVPAGLRLNDSNLVLEAVRLGPAWRWSGAGGGGDSPRRAGAAHRRHRPYPWHYWLTVSPQAENRPEVARFIAWLEEEIALWRQQISA